MTNEVVRTSKLSKIYQLGEKKFYALNNVDLSISQGEFVSIVGASGSGKSTLLNMLGAIDSPSEGTIEIANTKVNGMSEKEKSMFRNRKIGFVFQFFQLIPTLTCIDNVAMPLEFAKGWSRRKKQERAAQLLQVVGLFEQANKFPSELSGGEQQRVAIARALVNHPSILLADEPTGNLDSQTSERIFQLLQTLSDKGMTILMITHNDDLASRCERCIRIKDGKIVSDFKRNNVKERWD